MLGESSERHNKRFRAESLLQSMTITPITSHKAQVKLHASIAKRYQAIALEVHMAACQDLLHAQSCGDVSLCQNLYNALGGKKSYARTATLKEWFRLMSGGQMSAEGDTWKMKKGWSKDKFLMERAEKEAYWTLGGEKDPVPLTLTAILKLITGFTKRIEKAEADHNFQGDPAAAKAILAEIIQIADVRAKKLTAQQLGTVPATVPTVSNDAPASTTTTETPAPSTETETVIVPEQEFAVAAA
jgi:hypothetical protein